MYSSVDTIWVLLGAVLVFFMQAGFAMVETGFTRAKNAGNIIMKNLMDFALGTIVFWVLGFGLMFGASNYGIIGTLDLFVQGDYSSTIPTYAFLIFQTVFCATAATIVSGAMAERTKFSSYLIYSAAISAVIYPISGHWIWGGGWLSQLGFHDFAGSTAVHMVGGVAAFVGAKIVGARIGKYDEDGKPKAILGHSVTLGALGVFILWFAWFGFNAGSTLSATGDDALLAMSTIFVTTNIAAAVSATTTMALTWFLYKKPDVSMTLNGALAGLVAITAGCDAVSPIGALFIGLIAAFVVVFGIEFIDKTLKIDDPVGAIGVHGFCGAAGTILVGLFSLQEGLFYGHGAHLLGVQLTGVIAVIAWVAISMTILFTIIKSTVGLRVSREEEVTGLDIEEHGLESSYADFMPTTVISSIPVSEAIPVKIDNYDESSDKQVREVVVVMNKNKFESFKASMEKIGISGMTVVSAYGCGMQKGNAEYYRGVKLEMQLIPKVKVEIVIAEIPLDLVIKTAKQSLYTGNIGDGKIFVYNVDKVIKIRTGEEDFDAIK
ncbi:ammonium transporter [Clostridium sp.]|uniref:ammonium transporter n=1 Tax=Clostridium sp. TaxID=1506 RepID=UPI001A4E21B5|nr:ammonium transporter [Clostridium sp.]MBK5235409.1 ammonium transporter [Clostridium sp.]